MGKLADIWVHAAMAAGVGAAAAEAGGADLEARYAEPHRRYHVTAHALAVARDAAELGEASQAPAADRQLLTLAACAHDVVYDARSGDDERASAEWSRRRLAGASDRDRERVAAAVIATITHTAEGDDPIVPLLLDADLAILAAPRDVYDGYVRAVRVEYSAVPEELWRPGRAAVLRSLVQKRVFITDAAHDRWEQAARENVARELASLEAIRMRPGTPAAHHR